MGSPFPTGNFLISSAHIPPFYLGGVRFIIAGIAPLLYYAFRYGIDKIIPKAEDSIIRGWINLFFIGVLQTACAMGFLNLAFGYINSALAAVLFFTNPFWVLTYFSALLPYRSSHFKALSRTYSRNYRRGTLPQYR